MLEMLANIGVAIIAVLHIWFCVLETYFWSRPLGCKMFGMSRELALQSAPLAANQGLYNLFLSAGLFWGLLSRDPVQAFNVKVFFLSCVIVAGLYAGATVNRRILLVQAFPALLTLVLLCIS